MYANRSGMGSQALDKIFIDVVDEKSGKTERIPALHPSRKQEVRFLRYLAPPLDLNNQAVYAEWIERCTYLEDDLHWILRQPHDLFWCQIIFDDTLHRCVDSYLQHAPRWYDVLDVLPADARKKHDNIHRLFFLVCLRMATHKESKDHFITPEVFGDILYENYIFDIPKLMDVCVLFGPANAQVIQKLVENVFTKQSKYRDDLRASVPTVMSVFNNIQTKCDLKVKTSFSPEKLTMAGVSKRLTLVSCPLGELEDIVFFLSDTCATLWAFLDIYPAAACAFAEEDFPVCLAFMYENLIAAFNEAFQSRKWPEDSQKPVLVRKVRQAQKDLLRIFRQIITQTYLQPALESRDDAGQRIEICLELLTTILGERMFTAHYDHMFPFSDDRELLSQSSYNIDETRLHFIQSGMSEARLLHEPKPRRVRQQAREELTKEEEEWEEDEEDSEDEFGFGGRSLHKQSDEREELYGACAARLSEVELVSLIYNVKDLLPDLGEGYIEICLEELDYDVEKVINAVLEDRLPASLAGIDKSLPRQAPPPTEQQTDLLSERRNIYDNDEFDLFNRRDVDFTRIHQGKKEKGLEMKLLDDKKELESIRPLYERYGIEDVESMYDKRLDYEDDYEDEYDDTYDDNNVGAGDADSAEELIVKKPLNVGTLGRRHNWAAEQSDEENEDGPRRDLFVEDPAKIRERQAQRWASQRGRQGGRAPPVHDVKGKGRGQGQEKEVLKNRAYKEKNKATRVHHNRKNLADKKRKL